MYGVDRERPFLVQKRRWSYAREARNMGKSSIDKDYARDKRKRLKGLRKRHLRGGKKGCWGGGGTGRKKGCYVTDLRVRRGRNGASTTGGNVGGERGKEDQSRWGKGSTQT